MRRRRTWLILFTAVVGVMALYNVQKVIATPAAGFSGKQLAKGTFGEIDVFSHMSQSSSSEGRHHGRGIWLSEQKTKGSSDLYVQDNTWQPGGNTGWHTHPGHSLIVVTEGTVTAYEGDDPYCKPHVYTAGMGFVDPGGDHVHIIRNETAVQAKTIAVQLIPNGADRRIDVVNSPGNCTF